MNLYQVVNYSQLLYLVVEMKLRREAILLFHCTFLLVIAVRWSKTKNISFLFYIFTFNNWDVDKLDLYWGALGFKYTSSKKKIKKYKKVSSYSVICIFIWKWSEAENWLYPNISNFYNLALHVYPQWLLLSISVSQFYKDNS